MNNTITKDPLFLELQFNQKWLNAGIIRIDNFDSIKDKYLQEEDKNTEHYRWRAFDFFWKNSVTISQKQFHILYDIGKSDSDYSMGRAIIFEVIEHKNCPLNLIEMAINDNDLTLARHALRCKKNRKSIRYSISQ